MEYRFLNLFLNCFFYKHNELVVACIHNRLSWRDEKASRA